MSYYENKAQPLTKDDFDKAINAIENSTKITYGQSPILYTVPPWIEKWLEEER